jgi:hypothetical protein
MDEKEEVYRFKGIVDGLVALASEKTPDWHRAASALMWALCDVVARHSVDEEQFLARLQNGGTNLTRALLANGMLPIGAGLEKEVD